MIYGANIPEYFIYGYANLNHKGRKAFVTDIDRFKFLIYFNHSERNQLFSNKYLTYEEYKKWYRRDVILFDRETDSATLEEFVQKHPSFIVKPIRDSSGHGIEIINTEGQSIKEIINQLEGKGDCVLEELIQQSEWMKVLHPESVNTVRITAFRVGHEIIIHRPFFRIGIGNAVVDNGGSGGMLIAIEENSGITISCGIDEAGNTYFVHPNTHISIMGYKLPEWEELKKLVQEIMNKNSEFGCIGWDFAHTDSGWVLVEGNEGPQFVGQQMTVHNDAKRRYLN